MARKKVKQVEQELEDLENRLKRALADYANLEKRILREKGEFVKLANAQLLDKMLAILDELELCQEHLQDKGLAMVCQRFQEVLASEGIKEIAAQDKEFDPETMDAVEIIPGAKNKVKEVVMKGYLLNDKVLRPAKVKVGQGKEK